MASAIDNATQLDEILSTPTDYLLNSFSKISGDIAIIGAGGKMGPSLSIMARRALDAIGSKAKVYAVSRFSNNLEKQKLDEAGIITIRCDILNLDEVMRLPQAPNAVFMVGMKFGTSSNQSLTWATNTCAAGYIAEKYKSSKIAVFSTGNIYGLVPLTGKGSLETDTPNPAGEYAMSALGRERIFEYFSNKNTTPISIIRLNYACELRYGVLLDIAAKVWNQEVIDLSMGYTQVIWQQEANAISLASLAFASSPPNIINISGGEILKVKDIAQKFATVMNKQPKFEGKESSDALLSNSDKASALFGKPQVNLDNMVEWISDWVMRGGETLNKPTHFENREGKF